MIISYKEYEASRPRVIVSVLMKTGEIKTILAMKDYLKESYSDRMLFLDVEFGKDNWKEAWV